MFDCGWFEPVLRNAQPVLMVVSCLCLCLGSCFPSSEPLNRISSPRRRSLTTSTEMPHNHISRTVPHRTLSSTDRPATMAQPSQNVFISPTLSSNSNDPHFRNMDAVLKYRLESSGQISSNVIPQPPSRPSSVNSTNNGDNVNSSINALTDNTLTKPRKNRHRHRPVASTETSISGEQSQTRRHTKKQKKRERLSQSDTYRPSRTSTRLRLEPSSSKGGGAGKKRKNGGSRSGLESRTARTKLRGFSFCNRIRRRWRDIRQLSNARSWTLAVYSDGTVTGTKDVNDIYTFLVFVAYRHGGFVRIYAEAADKYVCMDNVSGDVYAAENASEVNCVFHETVERSWTNTYSLLNSAPEDEPQWYLGISKKGEVKSGRRVRGHQMIAQFVLLSPSFPEETCPGGNPDI